MKMNTEKEKAISLVRKRFRRVTIICTIISVFLFVTGFTSLEDDLFNIGKGIDLFGSIYKELTFNYVEKVNPLNLMKSGIKGMLSSLDPYTTFIESEDRSDVDMLTTGSYGGIGITVTPRSGRFVVTNIMDENDREINGLRIGDQILKIDTILLNGETSSDLKRMLRGKPGTSVQLQILRPGTAEVLTLDIKRRDVPIKAVSLIETIDSEIGYIKLDRFTRSTGEDVRSALKVFLADTSVKGIILDLRDNPGGLLDAAVDVTEKFVPRGSLIVSTKGRHDNYSREYFSEEDPLAPAHPLVVLANVNSASASEIVAGAIQDLDRGVILGTRTFGKGLVQSIVPLNYNASLKLTTSKYYTPSGRCIQKVEYWKQGSDAVVIFTPHDTNRIFYTLRARRHVREYGGIEPDIVIPPDTATGFVQNLVKNGAIFDFVTINMNTGRLHSFSRVDNMIKIAFKAYFDTTEMGTENETETLYSRFLMSAEKNGFNKQLLEKAKSLSPLIRKQEAGSFDRFWHEIKREIELEIAAHLGGKKMKFVHSRSYDTQLRKAIELLKNREAYSRIINPEM